MGLSLTQRIKGSSAVDVGEMKAMEENNDVSENSVFLPGDQ